MPTKLVLLGLAILLGIPNVLCLSAPIDWPAIQLTEVLSDLVKPTAIVHAGDGSGRMFIAERAGRIRVAVSNQLVSTPFLDLSNRVTMEGEGGLLSLAFPPGYASNGWLYVCYTATGNVWTISRMTPPRSGQNSEWLENKVISIPHARDQVFHVGGQIAFGPDGFLYASRGDGTDRTNAPILTNLWGKILRLDVESDLQQYQIPPDNPFVGQPPLRPEIWAFGLRNPWRFSFDRLTGDLYIGDVGSFSWEEINFQPASSAGGQNYGWPWREGAHDYEPPSTGYDLFQLTEPVAEYPRCGAFSISVIGGYVHRGPGSERLNGVYFYGDYDGRVWGMKRNEGRWATLELASSGMRIVALGEDEAGHIYVANHTSGKIYRLDDSGITARPYFGTECSFFQGQAIRVYASAPNSVLHHTLDGSDPTENSPPIVSGATVTATNGTILKIRAFSAARPPSEIRSIAFDAAEILAPELTGVGDTLQFAWFGARGRTYEVQASENLSFWITIRANLLGSDATIRITESMNRSPNSLRFYRVVKR